MLKEMVAEFPDACACMMRMLKYMLRGMRMEFRDSYSLRAVSFMVSSRVVPFRANICRSVLSR